MSTRQLFRIAGAVAFATILGACTNDVVAPIDAYTVANVPALAVTGGPDLGDWQSFQGEVWICKDGNQTGTSFGFDWAVSTLTGTPVLSGTVNVPLGTCVLAVHLDTTVTTRAHIAVTEHALATNWALTSITYSHGTNFPGTVGIPIISLPGRTIGELHASNDFGAVVTFTNTYTPPSPTCTYTQGFWKNHQELWDEDGEMVIWTGDTFFNSGKTYAEIFDMSAAGGNSYVKLAHQYMAVKLNVNFGSDPVINAYIVQAEAYFSSLPSGFYVKSNAWNALAEVLDNYNEGVIGPGHCSF